MDAQRLLTVEAEGLRWVAVASGEATRHPMVVVTLRVVSVEEAAGHPEAMAAEATSQPQAVAATAAVAAEGTAAVEGEATTTVAVIMVTEI